MFKRFVCMYEGEEEKWRKYRKWKNGEVVTKTCDRLINKTG